MKKNLLFWFLLLSLFLTAQGNYKIDLQNLTYKITRNVKNQTSSHIELRVYYADGTYNQMYHSPLYDDATQSNVSWTITTNKKPVRIWYDVFVNFSHTSDIEEVLNFDVSKCPLPKSSFQKEYDGMTISFNYNVSPLLIIEDVDSSNNFLATSTKTSIKSQAGFDTNNYNWEYSTDGVNYIALPQYNGQSSIEVNAVDILGSNINSYIGQFIQIRQVSACGNYSNIVQYRVLKSAPKIINHGPSVKTTCYDSNDGQYRLYFDRPLDNSANEYISIGLINVETGIPINYVNITQLESDNSFNLTDLPAGNYQLKIIGKYNGVDTYSETTANPIIFTVAKNPPVNFSITKTDVWCYQGTDGQIQITASGGTGNGYEYQLNGGNWIPFSNPSSLMHTINGLTEGTYTLKVRDGNSCVAKVQSTNQDGEIVLGAEKELSTTITAPQEPLSIEYTLIQEPTYNGSSNGKLVAKIDGGTISDNNKYWFEWKNEQGQIVSATTQFTSGSFYITLDNIPAGKYYLTIRDKNYSNATDNNNCTIIESEIELTQPEPLTAIIELIKPISCYNGNDFGDATDANPQDGQWDESQDGILKVIASGGKPFTGSQNGGQPYKYTWKKQNSAGVWEILSATTDTITQLSDGNYAVNVEDSNGIIIGIYQNNVLVEATDVTYYLQQPTKLEISFESNPATCAGSDGRVKAIVSGGTAPYTYSWSNGETTSEITGLPAMSYFVTVTDARGCLTQGTVVVSQPDTVNITENITPLLCYNASDASIEVLVTGGTKPYSYVWNTGATTSSIHNLTTGTYNVTITDGQGCSYVKSYTIDNPQEIIIDLREDRTLCNGQTLDLDATIPTEPGTKYTWSSTNGFTASTAKVTLAEAGTYTITAVTPKGCVISDEITITRSNVDIDAEFLLTTQAYANEEVVLVNVSDPKGQTTEWIVEDRNVVVVNEGTDYVTLRFPQEGTYNIQLKQTQGDCFMLYDKKIIVEKNKGQYNPVNTNAGFIKEFTVTPNPNNGNFNVIVKLEDESSIKLRLFTMAGQIAQPEKSSPSSKVHNVNYNIQISSGTYVLVLETPYQVLTKKLIIY